MDYKTPGVYIEEISVFPPSVAQVETAIPAFIGYTESATGEDGKAVTTFPFVRRITSLLEYQQFFGEGHPQPMTVAVADDQPQTVDLGTLTKYRMYYALQLFYANGGGPCYIVSVGQYQDPERVLKADLIDKGLAALRKKDEPTLILFPDAHGVDGADENVRRANFYEMYKMALTQCSDLGDRFTIADLFDITTVSNTELTDFRTGIGSNFLKYGAAYAPGVRTTLPFDYDSATITFDAPDTDNANGALNFQNWNDIKTVVDAHNRKNEVEGIQSNVAAIQSEVDSKNTDAQNAGSLEDAIGPATTAAEQALEAATLVVNAYRQTGTAVTQDAQDARDEAQAAYEAVTDAGADIGDVKTASGNAKSAADKAVTEMGSLVTAIDDAYNTAQTTVDTVSTDNGGGALDIADIKALFTDEFENQLAALVNAQRVDMPASPAVAGVYAMVDSTRGVWKAPANVSLNAVTAPLAKVSNTEQDLMNVDSTGKSVNAIRAFTGKGILIWGARTLAGNDNEWRYVPVRRFFNMVEESVKKSTESFVFEPNDANTWLKVRAMIENFLTLQWRAGALAGATPEEAFFVRVGLGTTMTADDVLNGRMIVEIGMAAVRPAEFIILRFMHKMQES